MDAGIDLRRLVPMPSIHAGTGQQDSKGKAGSTDSEKAKPDDGTELRALVEEFNDKYFVVRFHGKTLILTEVVDPILLRASYEMMAFSDFKRLYSNRTVRVGTYKDGNPRRENAAEAWLKHPDRRQYINGVVFDPTGKDRPGTLNLWTGFAVTPKRGSWKRLYDHIHQNICHGNAEHTDFLLNWMARMFQFPAEQAEIAIVLKGKEGTGKGILGRCLLKIFGRHGLAISNAKHLVGNFNAHLQDCVFLFADEAFFAGDRQHTGVLKAIITEPTLTIEQKNVNAFQAANFLHPMLASNEQWVVPASIEARRWFVALMAETHRGDAVYFGKLQAELENGGYEAFLFDMLRRDISRFNHRKAPDTDGLKEQKQYSLPTAHRWWMDVLHRGFIYESQLGLDLQFCGWTDTASTELLWASYLAFAKTHHDRYPLSRETFGRFLAEFAGTQGRFSNLPIGEAVCDVDAGDGRTVRKAQVIRHPRPTGYSLGSLELARAVFAEATGTDPNWPLTEREEADIPGGEKDTQ